ncbi:hypothetical protein [Micromonospora sp. HK10]|uniref:hypothetical protein n=1 Tax=Micromonospora sp. HK10 TaxID=1538294 RepID=UPI0012E30C01|nr:hypothetical protein [Micromonospora sp. HK10]
MSWLFRLSVLPRRLRASRTVSRHWPTVCDVVPMIADIRLPVIRSFAARLLGATLLHRLQRRQAGGKPALTPTAAVVAFGWRS